MATVPPVTNSQQHGQQSQQQQMMVPNTTGQSYSQHLLNILDGEDPLPQDIQLQPLHHQEKQQHQQHPQQQGAQLFSNIPPAGHQGTIRNIVLLLHLFD
jgi:hypothetical protein